MDAEALVEGTGKFRANLVDIVGKEGKGSSPERNVPIDEDVAGA